MGHQDDKAFVRNFSTLIAGLAVFAVVIAIFAGIVNTRIQQSPNPSALAAAEERIRPIAAVHAGEAGQLAVAEPDIAPEPSGAFDGSMDGELIYNNVCLACHQVGVAGAPIPGSDAWAEREAKGLETLVSNAVNGIGAMPPKGGRVDLTEAQVQASVEFMMEQ